MQNELIELETKLAFQEDTIQTLNLTVVKLQQEMFAVKGDIAELQTQLRALAPSLTPGSVDEPPPHY
jgi:SlyX protein